jgi:hypothetical protein
MTSFESLGFIKCEWSGFHWYRANEFEDLAEGYSYAEGFLVLGFFVYHYRIWKVETK